MAISPTIARTATCLFSAGGAGGADAPPRGGFGNGSGQPRALRLALLAEFQPAYKSFVHLRDEANTTLVNGDHLPYDNLVPTIRWPFGSVVKETIRLDLPPGLAPGIYQLFVGIYDPGIQERLSVREDTSDESAVVIPLVWNAQ